MTWIALALIALNIATVAGLCTVIRSVQRAAARERGLLINQVMHLADKTWTPPPADQWKTPETGEPLVQMHEWTAAPEQQPLYQ